MTARRVQPHWLQCAASPRPTILRLPEGRHWAASMESLVVRLLPEQRRHGAPPTGEPNVEQGLTDLAPICRQSLERRTMQQLYDLNSAHAAGPHTPDDLWVHVIYDVATTYPHQIPAREHRLKSLTPLYGGRTASFVLAAQRFTSAEIEHAVEHLYGTFAIHKPYLLEGWDGLVLRSSR